MEELEKLKVYLQVLDTLQEDKISDLLDEFDESRDFSLDEYRSYALFRACQILDKDIKINHVLHKNEL